MNEKTQIQLTKLEAMIVVVIIGCMLFAAWELTISFLNGWVQGWLNSNWFAGGLRIFETQPGFL